MKELPPGWVLAQIKDLVLLNPKNDCEDSMEVGFVPLQLLGIRFQDQHSYELRSWHQVKKGYTHFANGDVLLARITPSFENGKAGIAKGLPSGLGAGSTEYFVCRPIEGTIVPEYLLAYFKTRRFLEEGKRVMTGAAGQQRVPKQYLLESRLPLAPFKEQKRIADKLNALLTRVDACRDRLDRVPLILKQFRQAVLISATSGQLTKDWRRETDTSNWKFERAEDVCEKVQSGGTPKEGFVDIPGIPFLKVYNIVEQKIDFQYKPQYVTLEVHDGPLAKSSTKPGDVLMNIVGPPLGKVAIVPDDYPSWNINQAITLFRPSEKISTEWLYYFLCSGASVAEIAHQTRGSAGQSNISLSQCRNFIFPVPSREEQDEIVLRIETLFAYADRLELHYQTAYTQIAQLTPNLLDKAFRGELVAQDINDEPADKLLERIRSARITSSVQEKKPTRRNHMVRKAERKGNTSEPTDIVNTLRAAGKRLPSDELFVAAGYPVDSDSDLVEAFLVAVRDALNDHSIIKLRRNNIDWFSLASE